MSNPESVTKVKDLKPGMEGITIDVRVLESFGTRTIETKAGMRTLGEYIVGDDTGRVKLVVWGQKASLLNVGDVIEIKNAWVTSFKGEVQLNAGKNSEFSKLSDDAVVSADSIPEEMPKAEGGKPLGRSRFGRGSRGRGRFGGRR
ncbi:OB-fold nucleic acid binding domain-containing protein [Ignisphaera sp. 4213-co]|uniref:OB-fold nucleic acid binding domain-containing protein n=1 Tax=Ignisphaera cupida TaxID=3050454 RepID=A0ABD4Z4V6_9CREN|nr:OB-fold nucleic acid binding domain-containing protein [Ignisphaera sp. 4213-co]MDK6028341.1 OB-fold nucleic acid binding domain-containing protein [Ignisphaera sp. 4213-co]